jgi:phosphatidylglycerophosphate synthase
MAIKSIFENRLDEFIIYFLIRNYLDLYDGTIARYCNKESSFGTFLDKFIDYLFYFAFFIAVGIKYNKSIIYYLLCVILYSIYFSTNIANKFVHDNSLLIVPLSFIFIKIIESIDI